jgi:hypothetical protein
MRDPNLKTPYRVLRIIPVTPADSEDVVVAKVDFVHADYKMFLFDCELCRRDDPVEASVQTTDPRALMRYYLEPGFRGEIDFAELVDQLNIALCRYYELPDDTSRTSSEVLDEFLSGPRWQEWIHTHQTVPSVQAALLDYLVPCTETR